MAIITESKQGLFPKPHEIKLTCSCPDWAGMCKHLAAVLYGVGATLDHKPEWLFLLRQVDHLELIAQAAVTDTLTQSTSAETIAEDDLSSIFGIDISEGTTSVSQVPSEKPVSVNVQSAITAQKTESKKQKTSAKKAKGTKMLAPASSKSSQTKKSPVKTLAVRKRPKKTSATKAAQKKPSLASIKTTKKATKSGIKRTTLTANKKKTAAKKSKTKTTAKTRL